MRFVRRILSYHILFMAAGCGIIFYAPFTQAADKEIIIAARACAKQEWVDKTGPERSQAYRDAVNCFKSLYIRVASHTRSNEAFEKELNRRLEGLETAYHASRDVCHLQEKLGLEDRGCGTGSLSLHEFIYILKKMILNADAGWVRRDPALTEALMLDK